MTNGPFGEIRSPTRWGAIVVLLIAVLTALAMMLGDRRGQDAAKRSVGGAVTGGAASIAALGAAPARWFGSGFETIGDYFDSAARAQALRVQLSAARSWRDEALTLRRENQELRALLALRTDPPLPMVAAQAVLETRGPYTRSLILDAGAARGVAEGFPVMSAHGLLGRIVGVSSNASRVLLLTDPDSHTPVMIPEANIRAILTGDAGDRPKLAWIRGAFAPKPGERVYTSGDGGVLPRGLPVGVVVRAESGVWRVALDADTASPDAVRILQFRAFDQLASPASLAPTQMPGTATEPPAAARPAPEKPPERQR
jgi:rod shape-determining protein MreC